MEASSWRDSVSHYTWRQAVGGILFHTTHGGKQLEGFCFTLHMEASNWRDSVSHYTWRQAIGGILFHTTHGGKQLEGFCFSTTSYASDLLTAGESNISKMLQCNSTGLYERK